jgi:exodeoxyribonuclease VII large subunit
MTATAPLRPDRPVLTPSRLNAEAQVFLEENFGVVWIEGELSNLARPGSGHWYFTLKDRRAQVRCAMFRGRNARVRFRPEDGMQVLLRGRVSLYVGRGEFQVVVDAMEPAGEGALRLAFEQLRARLAEEGLFADERKRPLPALPRRIAVITSPTGAAVRDVLSVLARRWPIAEVVLVPTSVQGDAATAEIVAAFERVARWCETDPGSAPDLVVAGRGGGSLENLWCFNEEAVARAIVACPVPVVSAVGHESDYTIADFVADLRAPTPSAAAELATPDVAEWRSAFAAAGNALVVAQRRRLAATSETVDRARRRLKHPGRLLEDRAQRVDELALRARRRTEAALARRGEALEALRGRLTAAGPLGRLAADRRLLDQLATRLRRASPAAALPAHGRHVAELERRLERAEAGRRAALGDALANRVAQLRAMDPLAVVDRGYALLTHPPADGERFGALVRDAAEVAPGTTLHARLARGTLAVRAEGPVEDEREE